MATRKEWDRMAEAIGDADTEMTLGPRPKAPRCCVVFVSGKRCKHEAVDGSWCVKHKPIMEKAIALEMAVIKAQAKQDARSPLDDEEEGE
jgi:hypothetical protein